MRWDEGHESPDVIDRRGQGVGGGGGLGGGMLALLPFLMRSRGGRIIALLLLGFVLLSGLFGGLRRSLTGETGAHPGTQGTDEQMHFVSFVLDDAQNTWRDIFARNGATYRNAKLVLFTDATNTACGQGQAATGPFYCPVDERVYIDLGFYDELAKRFGAKGDFAQAYVIAHELGHHVQNQLGITKRVEGQRLADQTGAESASVRLELQADCFAGIWAHSTEQRQLLERGDIDEAIGAASAVGDDRIQRKTSGRVNPESFTHGTAEQRARWFKRGYDSGQVGACDTFGSDVL